LVRTWERSQNGDLQVLRYRLLGYWWRKRRKVYCLGTGESVSVTLAKGIYLTTFYRLYGWWAIITTRWASYQSI